ncbi:MAG: MarR family transcriptional regulator [Cohaesibacter sp.]|nr:MarR family transcriptional regulator [Cohaesibacter sp.]
MQPSDETSPPPYVLEDQIGFKLRLANQKHLELFSSMMPSLTPTQFATMAKLKEVGELSQNHLGRLVGMDAATTKGVVDRLTKKGMVSITPSETDRRRLLISLSDQGKNAISDLIEQAQAISQKTMANLTKRERERLLELLTKL